MARRESKDEAQCQLFAWVWMVRRERGITAVLVVCWLLLNGTGELFLGRAGFTWAAQARMPILAFPLLLGAVAWYRTALIAAISDATRVEQNGDRRNGGRALTDVQHTPG